MAKTDTAANIFKNPFGPFWTAHDSSAKGMSVLPGFAFNIAVETAVEQLIRRFMKRPRRVFASAATHALAQGFHGGLFPWGEKGWDENLGAKTNEGRYTRAFQDGLKGVPATLVAKYIVDIMGQGIFWPGIVIPEILTVIGSKAVARPIAGFILQYVPQDVVDAAQTIDKLFNRQREVSNFSMKEAKKSG